MAEVPIVNSGSSSLDQLEPAYDAGQVGQYVGCPRTVNRNAPDPILKESTTAAELPYSEPENPGYNEENAAWLQSYIEWDLAGPSLPPPPSSEQTGYYAIELPDGPLRQYWPNQRGYYREWRDIRWAESLQSVGSIAGPSPCSGPSRTTRPADYRDITSEFIAESRPCLSCESKGLSCPRNFWPSDNELIGPIWQTNHPQARPMDHTSSPTPGSLPKGNAHKTCAEEQVPLEIFAIDDQAIVIGPEKTEFTDSGIGMEYLPRQETAPEANDHDVRTQYSDPSVSRVSQTENFVAELCGVILQKVGWTVDKTPWRSLSHHLPRLIKTFALRLGHDSLTPECREIMFFIHKNHSDIAAHLTGSLMQHDDEKPTNGPIADDKGMTLLEKMVHWWQKDDEHDRPPDGEICQGVSDLEDSTQISAKFEQYREIVTGSDAFRWFLTMVKRQSAMNLTNLETELSAMAEISEKVMSTLATGRVSKHRGPPVYRMMLSIPWSVPDCELWKRLDPNRDPKEEAARIRTVVGSSRNVQTRDCLAYSRHCWPLGGEDVTLAFFEAMQRDMKLAGKSMTLGDKTELYIQKSHSFITIKVTGLASSLSLCAEQFAWLGATFYCLHRVHPARCTPRLESSLRQQESETDKARGLIEFTGHIQFTVTPLDAQRRADEFWRIHSNSSIINGYPCLPLEHTREFPSIPSGWSSQPLGAGPSSPLGRVATQSSTFSRAEAQTDLTSPDPPTSVGVTDSSNLLTPGEELDSDMLSISNVADVTIPDKNTFAILEQVKTTLAEGFLRTYCHPSDAGCQDAPDGTSASSTSGNWAFSLNSFIPSQTNSNKRKRPARGQDEGDDQGEDENGAPKRREKKTAQSGARSLACPFFKLDTTRHLRCLYTQITRRKDVKSHLASAHSPDYFCDRCGTIFKDESTYEDHKDPPCMKNPAEVEAAAMTTRKRNAIIRRANYHSNDESAWYAIWDQLFPGRERPTGIYIEDRFAEYAHLLQIHCKENYRSALQTVTSRGPIQFDLGETAGWEDYLHSVILDVSDIVFRRWHAQQSGIQPASSGLGDNSNISQGVSSTSAAARPHGGTEPVLEKLGAVDDLLLPLGMGSAQGFAGTGGISLQGANANLQNAMNNAGFGPLQANQFYGFQGQGLPEGLGGNPYALFDGSNTFCPDEDEAF